MQKEMQAAQTVCLDLTVLQVLAHVLNAQLGKIVLVLLGHRLIVRLVLTVSWEMLAALIVPLDITVFLELVLVHSVKQAKIAAAL